MTGFTISDRIDPALDIEQRVAQAYKRIAEVDRPEIWITLRAEADVLTDAAAIRERRDAGEKLPLYGFSSQSRTTSTSPGYRPQLPAPNSREHRRRPRPRSNV